MAPCNLSFTKSTYSPVGSKEGKTDLKFLLRNIKCIYIGDGYLLILISFVIQFRIII